MLKRKIVRVQDITLPKDYSVTRTGITQSLLTHFQMCRQKFLFAVNRWSPDIKNKNTQLGSLFHEMLDKAYHQSKPPSSNTMGKWIDNYMEEKHEDFSMMQDPKERDRIAAIVHMLMDEYIRYYPEDWKEKRFTAIERTFDINYKGFRLRGKKDGRYDDKNKKHWIMEHKTKGQIDEEFLGLALAFDLQNLFYITAEEEEFKIKIQGVLYNIVRNPGAKIRSMESVDAYANRIRIEIRKKPAHFFKRFEIYYPEEEKQRFRKELYSKLVDANAVLTGSLPIYRNEAACKVPFPCQFLNACSSGTMVGYKQKPELFEELK